LGIYSCAVFLRVAGNVCAVHFHWIEFSASAGTRHYSNKQVDFGEREEWTRVPTYDCFCPISYDILQHPSSHLSLWNQWCMKKSCVFVTGYALYTSMLSVILDTPESASESTLSICFHAIVLAFKVGMKICNLPTPDDTFGP